MSNASIGEAWIHPNPLLSGWAVLPDGYQISVEDAKAKGISVVPWPDTAKAATRHPYERDSVVTARGAVITRLHAEEVGFYLSETVTQSTSPTKLWRAAIVASPEANERPSAAAELLSQSHTTMTVDAARAFLRGLPTEQTEELTTVSTTIDPKAARLAEIESGMAAHNRGKGYGNNKQSLGVASALSAANADPVKMKRVAEIRLNAISLRMRQGETHLASEHKKLAYALSVHAQTGVPLATVFTQMSIDTSKMLKGQ